MMTILQVNERAIAPDEIIPLLSKYHLLPHLMRELVIDQAIADIELLDSEVDDVMNQVKQQSDRALEALSEQSIEQIKEAAIRWLKIQKFKQRQWQHKLEGYFLERKSQLDQVIYSMLRTQDRGAADELYFRILEGEQSFAELAKRYSEGPEALTGGIVGPVELGSYPPNFARLLATSQPGQLLSPIRLEGRSAIIRVEEKISAQLDEETSQRLLNEQFERWIQQQIEG